jgi:hypothetical protein
MMNQPVNENSPDKMLVLSSVATCGVVFSGIWLPAYFITVAGGNPLFLYLSGWAGDSAAAWITGNVTMPDYSSLWVSSVIPVVGAVIILVLALTEPPDKILLWSVLAFLAAIPLIAACWYLGTDGFPMPFFAGEAPNIGGVVTAGWGFPLWALLAVVAWSLGGTASCVLARSSINHERVPVTLTESLPEVVAPYYAELRRRQRGNAR